MWAGTAPWWLPLAQLHQPRPLTPCYVAKGPVTTFTSQVNTGLWVGADNGVEVTKTTATRDHGECEPDRGFWWVCGSKSRRVRARCVCVWATHGPLPGRALRSLAVLGANAPLACTSKAPLPCSCRALFCSFTYNRRHIARGMGTTFVYGTSPACRARRCF